jgi:hypothetical protein
MESARGDDVSQTSNTTSRSLDKHKTLGPGIVPRVTLRSLPYRLSEYLRNFACLNPLASKHDWKVVANASGKLFCLEDGYN